MLDSYPAAIVENIRLDRDGYDRTGRYYGVTRGTRVYRLADGETGLDFTLRARTRKHAEATLARAISAAYEAHAFWLRVSCEPTFEKADAQAWRVAARDAIAIATRDAIATR